MRFPHGPATVKLPVPSNAAAPMVAMAPASRTRSPVREAKSGDLPECSIDAGTSRERASRQADHSFNEAPARPLHQPAGVFHLRPGYTADFHCKAAVLASLLAVLPLIPLAGCGRSSPPHEDKQVTDELGRKLTLASPPQRIVSLAPSITETLFALGLKDRIVGVTSFCDYPQDVAAVEKVGDTQRPSTERIVALRADLVIASTSSQLEPFVKKLDELGVPVYVSNPRDLEGLLRSIEKIGELTGVGGRARELTAEMRARVEDVASRVEGRGRPPVLILLGTQPLITAGATSFLSDLIRRAGGRSISDDVASDYPQFSLETALARRPEVIFLQAGESNLPGRLNETPAARAGRVFHVNDDLLLRPGPRLVDGLEQIAAKIHPGDD